MKRRRELLARLEALTVYPSQLVVQGCNRLLDDPAADLSDLGAPDSVAVVDSRRLAETIREMHRRSGGAC